MAKKRASGRIPSRADILQYVREQEHDISRREIARAFGLRGAERNALKTLLRELEDEGALRKRRGRRYADEDSLPPVMVLRVSGLDRDGEPTAEPASQGEALGAPVIHVVDGKDRGAAPRVGDKILARLRRSGDAYEAEVIKKLGRDEKTVLGVFTRERRGGLIESADKRDRLDYVVSAGDEGGARTGDIVRAEIRPGRQYGAPQARITEVLGNMDDPGSASLIAIRFYGIPTEFTSQALEEASRAAATGLGQRADLRDFPLVTIDDEDARDFDDAVWAEPDGDGWHLLVAIADVAWYVRPGSALDDCARDRGNSVYFPDRVVPMLPEALSNGLCSLKPGEDRPCMAVHLWIDGEGRKRRHKFVRGMMRSAARLTYGEVQSAREGMSDERTRPLVDTVIQPLYGAYEALRKAREARGTLDLDLPEHRAILDRRGRILEIRTRERFDSHRLIEEFMILANVAAAETLERRRKPCMYRVHDQPPEEKLEALREFLDVLGHRFPKGQVITARQFNRLLARVRGSDDAEAVSEAVLRTQAQAVYDPDNIGHFGLALRRYAHFTSPIRRYADLLVHRAMIDAIGAGEGGLERGGEAGFARIAEQISMTERRAVAAERDTMDRLAATYLAERADARFEARINGVTRAGLFITLSGLGAGGLVPLSSLGSERFRVDEGVAVTGQRSRRRYRIGQVIAVRLEEADPVLGRMLFSLDEDRAWRSGSAGLGKRSDRKKARGTSKRR